MMQFFIEIKKQVLGISLGAFITAGITGATFYFNTNNTLNAHGNDIEIIKTHIKLMNEKVGNIAIKSIKLEDEILSLHEQVKNLENKIDKNNANINDRMDKIYEVLLSIKNDKK